MGWAYGTADNVPNNGLQITVIAIVFTIMSLTFLCLRFYVRGWVIKALGPDDWILVATWIAACGFAIVSAIQTKWGLGLKHVDDMPDANVYNFGLLQYIGAPFYISSILGFKLSLLLSYLRFMTAGPARIATIIVIVACTMFHLSFLLVQINLCQPVAKQWDPAITWGHCLTSVPFYTSMASLTIGFDVAVMFLPFPVLLRSRIQSRKKFVLLGLFALGFFITIIQILRILTVRNLSNYLDSSSLIRWSTIENNLGIIVACVPTLAPLFKYFAERTQRSTKSGSRDTPGSKYALQSWRGTKQGMYPLGSGVDQESHVHGPSKEGSQEFILSGIAHITKKTEVVISSHPRSESGLEEAPNRTYTEIIGTKPGMVAGAST